MLKIIIINTKNNNDISDFPKLNVFSLTLISDYPLNPKY